MECTLVMFKSDGTRKDIPLIGPRCVVGRMSTCAVRIPLNSVSREHCELLCDGQTLRYKDLNSSNGVIHNGAKSKQGVLNAGDELVIGPVVFTVMLDGRPAKITPIRTILNESDDKAFSRSSDGSRAGTTVDAPSLSAAIIPAAAIAVPAAVKVPLPPQPSREVGSSAEEIEVLAMDSDFEEFNPPAPKAPPEAAAKTGVKPASFVPSLPEPIGDDDDDMAFVAVAPKPAPAPPAKPATAPPAAVQPAPVQPAPPAQPVAAKDELAAAPSEDDGFEFLDDAHGDDEEEPAFTFE